MVGNPNVGKTTLFNCLTNLHQEVGNYAGVTVSLTEGVSIFNRKYKIVDLPGIYSLYNPSQEEKVAYKALKDNRFDLIINIVDINNLKQNLKLTSELIALNQNIILALNYYDEVKNKSEINFKYLENSLNVHIVPISALKRLNIDKLWQDVEILIRKPLHKLKAPINIDKIVNQSIKIKQDDRRYDHKLINKKSSFLIMFIIYFNVLFISIFAGGKICGSIIDLFTTYVLNELSLWLISLNVNYILIDFIVNGICLGLTTIFALAPSIIILFFLISLLQDSGYLARSCYLLDPLLRKIGLTGKAFIPLILGYGCSVPAIMSSRILTSKKEKGIVFASLSFLPCPGKMAIFIFLGNLFFKSYAFLYVISMYLLGIFLFICIAYILNKTSKEKMDSLILEIPKMRRPSLKNAYLLSEQKLKDYLYKGFSVILIASIVIWLMQAFAFNLNYVFNSKEESILASMSKTLSFMFFYLNKSSSWKITSCLLNGLIAKESVVSTMMILYQSEEQIRLAFSIREILSISVFILCYMPCIASFFAMKKELNSLKITIFIFLIMNMIALLLTYLSYVLLFFLK